MSVVADPSREIRERLWAAVDEARWVLWDRRRFKVYVWRGGPDVLVFDEFGVEKERWPIPDSFEPSPMSAEMTALERVHAGY